MKNNVYYMDDYREPVYEPLTMEEIEAMSMEELEELHAFLTELKQELENDDD